jgi:hypothetical protein
MIALVVVQLDAADVRGSAEADDWPRYAAVRGSSVGPG